MADKKTSKVRILLAEDDPVQAEEFRWRLTSMGYQVAAQTATGEDAIKKAEALQPDLVLMDISLAGRMSGIEAGRRIHQEQGAPVIFISGYVDDERLELIKPALPFGYLIKPVHDRELNITLKTALYISKSERQLIGALNALSQSEEKWRCLAENSPAFVFILDLEGRVRFLNRSQRGPLVRGKVIGRDVLELVHPDFQDQARKIMADAVRGQSFARVEIRAQGPKLSHRWFEVHVNPLVIEEEQTGVLVQALETTSRKAAAEELERYRERLETTLNALPDFLFELDAEGRILDYRTQRPESLYIPPEEFLDRRMDEVLPAEAAQVIMEALAQAAKNSSHQGRIYSLPDAQGRARFYEPNVAAKRGADGQLASFVLLVRDVTARQEALEALKESECRYRELFERESDMVLVFDAASRKVEEANMMAQQNLGFSGAQLAQMEFGQLCAQPQGPRRELSSLLAGQAKNVFIPFLSLKTRGGQLMPVEASAGVFEQRSSRKVIMSMRDISERLEAQEDLERARQEWESTFEAINDWVSLLGLDLRILRSNSACLGLTGIEAENICGLVCCELLHEPNEHPENCPVRRMLASGRREVAEMRFRGGRWGLVSADPVFDGEGRITGAVHIVRDITATKAAQEERKKLESQLRQSQKLEAIGTLASGIAHDFNNILGAIIGYADLTMLDMDPEDPLRANLTQVIKAGNRARDLVAQILTFSRKQEQEFRPLRVQPIVKEVLKFLRSSIPTTIEIQQFVDPAVLTVMGDPTQLHQVIMNLCANAQHAMKEKGGVLTVRVERAALTPQERLESPDIVTGEHLRLTVADTGSGMDGATIERIWEPYFTTKTQEEGTGMGLAVVHGIVRNHGGFVKVRSTPGQGSVFEVFLPLALVAEHEDHASQVKARGGDESIMFVDDEEALAVLAKSMLGRLGYRVTTMTDSPAALEAFNARPHDYDLVITDQTMPSMTGVQLARAMRSTRPDLPIIICTGFSQLLTPEQAEAMGIQAFLMKPLAPGELGSAVRMVLDKHTAKAKPENQDP